MRMYYIATSSKIALVLGGVLMKSWLKLFFSLSDFRKASLKGTKKGKYKIKVKVTAAGNKNYKSLSKTVTVTIKVV